MAGFSKRAGMTAAAVAAAALSASLTATAVSAQSEKAPKVEGRAVILQRLLDCRKEADDAARLACYDAQVAAVDQAEAKGDIVVVDREQARTVRRLSSPHRPRRPATRPSPPNRPPATPPPPCPRKLLPCHPPSPVPRWMAACRWTPPATW